MKPWQFKVHDAWELLRILRQTFEECWGLNVISAEDLIKSTVQKYFEHR